MDTLLFDFDGTLVDSMPTFVSTMLRVLDENNIPYTNDIVKIITPLGYDATASYYVELGVPMTAEEIKERFYLYALEEYKNNIPAKTNVVKTLIELKQRGFNINILTACPHRMLDSCLKRLEIFDLFSNVWSCDDFLCTKNDPKIYVMAAEKMDVSVNQIWFFDDNINANMAAASAGVKVCGVYDATSCQLVDEMKAFCDNYIYDFRELIDILV